MFDAHLNQREREKKGEIPSFIALSIGIPTIFF
jgi:hypothetical protein